MAITLKRNNRPRKSGYYIMYRIDYIHAKPELARVDPDFCVVYGAGIIRLSRLEKSALWSDRLDIEMPGVGV